MGSSVKARSAPRKRPMPTGMASRTIAASATSASKPKTRRSCTRLGVTTSIGPEVGGVELVPGMGVIAMRVMRVLPHPNPDARIRGESARGPALPRVLARITSR